MVIKTDDYCKLELAWVWITVAQYCENSCMCCRIAKTVVTQGSLRIIWPVRKTVLHKPNFYVSFHLILFWSTWCKSNLSWEKFLPTTPAHSIQMNTWTVSHGEGCLQCRWSDGIWTWIHLLAQGSSWSRRVQSYHSYRRQAGRIQAWLYHFQGVKGRTPFKRRGIGLLIL